MSIRVNKERICDRFPTFVDLLQQRAAEQPDRRAYLYLARGEVEAAQLTFSDLDARARSFAAWLQTFTQPGDTAVLLYPTGTEFLVAFFGCLYAGVIAIPSQSPESKRTKRSLSRLGRIVEDAQPRVVLATAEIAASLRAAGFDSLETQYGIPLHTPDCESQALAASWKKPTLGPDTLAHLQYTSGTTSAPRGTMITHRNLLVNSEFLRTGWAYTPESVDVVWVPNYHDDGLVHGLMQPVYGGSLAVLMPPLALVQDPLRWIRAIANYRATHSGGPNFMYDYCAARAAESDISGLDLSNWRCAYNAAEQIRKGTLDRFTQVFAGHDFEWKTFCPSYGMAETTLLATRKNPGEQAIYVTVDAEALAGEAKLVVLPSEREGAVGTQTFVGCGQLVEDTSLLIVNPSTLACCAADEVGEIWIANECVAAGYWKKEEATRITFHARPVGAVGGPRYLRTGDLGFLLDGQLYVTGRIKEMIIVRGQNYYPHDVVWAMQYCHPRLRAGVCAAFSVDMGEEERLVIVAEVRTEGSEAGQEDWTELYAAVRGAVAERLEIQPFAILLIPPNTLPKTSSGKIQHNECRRLYLAGEMPVIAEWKAAALLDEPPAPPAMPAPTAREGEQARRLRAFLEERVAALLGLPREHLNPGAPLSQLGVDSVAGVRLATALSQLLGRELPVTLVWNHPSIDALVQHLTSGEEAAAPAAEGEARPSDEPIAVIGIGCRFPGAADDPESFWRLLESGVDAITPIPADRWDVEALYDPDPNAQGKMYVRSGGFLRDIDKFDPAFFGISPREATAMDPQQRLLLEVAWHALEDAGVAPLGLSGKRVGVFVGISSFDYATRAYFSGDTHSIDPYSASGSIASTAAGRLSYTLGLTGPAMAVDTACSSSLVAIHLACQSLRSGEAELALAAGVNALLAPEPTIYMCRTRALSPRSRCHTFSAEADGYVRSEGCGVVVLKRLSRAQADGDPIYAVIRGSAVNQDGRSNGMTAPNGRSQEEVIRRALERAGVEPIEIGYLEAHGTGTPLGDPIEIGAVAAVLGPGRTAERPLLIGSVKTNIGHTEAAAGVAGLIKTALSLQRGRIPAHLHCQQRNPNIPWQALPIDVPQCAQDWPSPRRLAGVSSFGFSGTNAHLVLEAAPPPPAREATASDVALLSARSAEALRANAERHARHLQAQPSADLAEVCNTTRTGRTHLGHRVAVIAASTGELAASLAAFAKGTPSPNVVQGAREGAGGRPKLAWLFTGQGSQQPGMGRALYEAEPVFRDTVDRCLALLRERHGLDLAPVLFPAGDEAGEQIHQTQYTQPALFVLEAALAALWRSRGVTPDAVLGHSVGEIVAAHVAGVLGLEDALALTARRARLMQALPSGGAMVAVQAEERVVVAALAGHEASVSLAAVNGPRDVVISGERAAVEAVCGALAARGCTLKPLTVSHAFHSPLMRPMLDAFGSGLSHLAPSRPGIPLISNVSGAPAGDEILSPGYWCEHVMAPVRFLDGARALAAEGCSIFLELGPSGVLTALGAAATEDPRHVWIPSLRRSQDDRRAFLRAEAELYVHGVDPAAAPVGGARRTRLPGYAFERARYWIDRLLLNARPSSASLPHPLLGAPLSLPGEDTHYALSLDAPELAYLADHRVEGAPVVPGAFYVAGMAALGEALRGAAACVLREVAFVERLPIERGRALQLVARREESGARQLTWYSRSASGPEESWRRHAAAVLLLGAPADAEAPTSLKALRARCTESLDLRGLRERCERLGLDFGPEFQRLLEVWRGEGEVLARIAAPPGTWTGPGLHPAQLDAAFQALACLIPIKGDAATLLLAGAEQVMIRQLPAGELWCHAQLTSTSGVAQPLTGQLQLRDAAGQALIEVAGLAIRILPRQRPAAAPARSARHLFAARWRPSPRPALALPEPGRWLVLDDAAGTGAFLAKRLQAAGHSCQRVAFAPDALAADAVARALEQASAGGQPLRGVVYLHGLDGPNDGWRNKGAWRGALALAQALCRMPLVPRLWLATRGACFTDTGERSVSMAGAAIWGLGRVLAQEHPELNSVLVDLAPEEPSPVDALWPVLALPPEPSQWAIRGETWYTPALVPEPAGAIPSADLLRLPDGPYRLASRQLGELAALSFEPAERRLPGPGEIEIAVEAVGLNFRDVLTALGMLPGNIERLGFECAGEVVAVGGGVTALAVGDPVLALAPGSFRRTVVVDARCATRRPAGMSAADAATIPVAFLTAWYALNELTRLAPGERVLIHAATGGVGMAAVQVARRAGATVWGTASESKAGTLRTLGLEHPLSSRSTAFSDALRALTGGAGVDVVLNSLNGELIDHSVRCLAPNGRFLEMGKLGIWSQEQMAAHRPDVQYSPFDLMEVAPDRIQSMLLALIAALEQGELRPLPRRVFAFSELRQAFRYMGNALHVGKIVLQPDPPAGAGLIDGAGTYLITGGAGALGLQVGRWLKGLGARHLVVCGRRAPSAKAQAAFDELREAGVDVRAELADVSDEQSVRALLARISHGLPPLRGVIHAAGVLDDGVLLQQAPDRFHRVLAPKVDGGWHLHRLTEGAPLELFVLFSSVSSLLGNPGQGNYAAANAALDALAHHRRLWGLPALTVNWGPWAGGGMVTSIHNHSAARTGLELLAPDEALEALRAALERGLTQAAVLHLAREGAGALPAALGALLAQPVPAAGAPAGARPATLGEALGALPPPERRGHLVAALREETARVLMLGSPAAVSPQTPLREIGLDSLMAVELRNAIARRIDKPLPAPLLFDHPTIDRLADHLLEDVLALKQPAKRGAPAPARPEREGEEHAIAVIGLGCRLPGGADGPESFWQLIRDGVDAISEVPSSRWSADAYYDPTPATPGKMVSRWGGFLADIERFDPEFFGISPREAASLDPQQRLLMEVSWEALERAGYSREQLTNRQVGVFVGIGASDYGRLQYRDARQVDTYSGTGTALSVAANRLSYLMDWRGPSMAVDTACSSSLVAVHLACKSLLRGESELVLAGGVNVILSPEVTVGFSQARMLSPTGRCRTFDASADGYVRAEGCGVIVLKRLADACRDGDPVLAVIRGSAVNQDGRSNGLTAPNGVAQEAVLREALADAGLAPADIDYVEAHGTGTPLGDPIEVHAVKSALTEGRPLDRPCFIGSVKTNIGHLETAAGIAGLIKLVLCLQHEEIPQHLHFRQLNPHIQLDDSTPIRIPTARQPWRSQAGKRRRRAGVSSFGFGGTNAHVILEEAPPQQPPPLPSDACRILPLSAASEEALRALAGRYADHLTRHPELDAASVCATASTGRSHLPHRLVVVGEHLAELGSELSAFSQRADGDALSGQLRGEEKPEIAFLFSGQGTQYPGMGQEIYQTEPVFRDALDRCDRLLQPLIGHSLLGLMFGRGEEGELLHQTLYTQPALFAFEYALGELWRAWGVECSAVMGHSVGEYSAALFAGVFNLEDGLRLICARARLMQECCHPGSMTSVFAEPDRVAEAIGPLRETVSLAAINGPRHVVISGEDAGVRAVAERLAQEGVETRPLKVSHAFHSPLMEPMLEAFEQVAGEIELSSPRLPLISNVTGRRITTEVTAPEYWRRHVRLPVQFASGVANLQRRGCDVLLEIGPHATLIGLAQQCLPEGKLLGLASLRRGAPERRQFLSALGHLYVRGSPVAWAQVGAGAPAQRVVLPTYPFQRQRCWLPDGQSAQPPADSGLTGPRHPLLGQRLPTLAGPKERFVWQAALDRNHLSFVPDHRIQGAMVVPGVVYMELARAAAWEARGQGRYVFRNVQYKQLLVVPDEGELVLQTHLEAASDSSLSFQIFSRSSADDDWMLHADGLLQQGPSKANEVQSS